MKRYGRFRDRLQLAFDRSPYETQKQLAGDLKMREATVSAWFSDEDPKMPSTAPLLRLPAMLGVRAEWLFYGQEPMVGGVEADRLTVIGRVADGSIDDDAVRALATSSAEDEVAKTEAVSTSESDVDEAPPGHSQVSQPQKPKEGTTDRDTPE